MRGPGINRLLRPALRAATVLALAVAPYHFATDASVGIVSAKALAGNGNGGNGNGGNGNGGNGNGNGNGNGGNNAGGNGNANAGPGNNNGKGNANPAGKNSYTNAATGDTLEVDGTKVTVIHRNGMTETVVNGRFEMTDAQGRTIVERQATDEDMARLLSL